MRRLSIETEMAVHPAFQSLRELFIHYKRYLYPDRYQIAFIEPSDYFFFFRKVNISLSCIMKVMYFYVHFSERKKNILCSRGDTSV